MNTTSVDAYLQDGCGRCAHYKTPQCKVLPWVEILSALRALLQATPLTETLKWGSPCYTLGGKNVVMLVSRREDCALSFLHGAQLADPHGILERPGPNSQLDRVVRFTTLEQVHARRPILEAYIAQAIARVQAGAPPPPPSALPPVPEALQAMLDADPGLGAAFAALTPGRQRSHILHVSGAKQPKTQADRAARCADPIRLGKGYNER